MRYGARRPEKGAGLGRTLEVAALLQDCVAESADPIGIRNRVLDMKPLDAVELLLWLLESLLHREDTMTLTPAPGLQLQPAQARLLHELDRQAPRVVTREALGAAVWRLDAADGELKTIDVQVSKVRNLLRAAGLPATIRTQRGLGYRLDRPDGLLNWKV